MFYRSRHGPVEGFPRCPDEWQPDLNSDCARWNRKPGFDIDLAPAQPQRVQPLASEAEVATSGATIRTKAERRRSGSTVESFIVATISLCWKASDR